MGSVSRRTRTPPRVTVRRSEPVAPAWLAAAPTGRPASVTPEGLAISLADGSRYSRNVSEEAGASDASPSSDEVGSDPSARVTAAVADDVRAWSTSASRKARLTKAVTKPVKTTSSAVVSNVTRKRRRRVVLTRRASGVAMATAYAGTRRV